jgi:hypothetical protein
MFYCRCCPSLIVGWGLNLSIFWGGRRRRKSRQQFESAAVGVRRPRRGGGDVSAYAVSPLAWGAISPERWRWRIGLGWGGATVDHGDGNGGGWLEAGWCQKGERRRG